METWVCGLDEAGRGPLAGPIVAAAVVFPIAFDFNAHFLGVALRDSKMLSRRQREIAYQRIIVCARNWQVEQIDVPDIDARNIGWANRTIFERLVQQVDADRYVVDGNLKLNIPSDLQPNVQCLVRADQSQPVVSAASIIAKVTRDRLMQALHLLYPVYGWDRNAGYCTVEHLAAIHTYGRSPQHRRQFVDTALRNNRTHRLNTQLSIFSKPVQNEP